MTELSPIPDDAKTILMTVVRGEEMIQGYEQYMKGEEIGSNTALIPEACDASASETAVVEDGRSG